MINDEHLPELTAFRAFEQRLPLWYTPKYGPLVVASGNESRPIHRWFRFKEGYDSDFLEMILTTLGLPRRRPLALLDPFCGCGTTLISADSLFRKGWDFQGIGIEVNPFIAFVADTKINWAQIRPQKLLSAGDAALKAAEEFDVPLPELTSISNGRCIGRGTARRLLALREAIGRNSHRANRNALLLGMAAAIEPLSKVRKDGRALRIVNGRARSSLSDTVRSKWKNIREDVSSQQKPLRSDRGLRVVRGDGRRPSLSGVGANSIDLIVTSPPYPNNIDYTEVYKLELWLMGFVSSSDEFLGQRRMTLRSHPTSAALDMECALRELSQITPLQSLIAPSLDRMDRTKDQFRKRLLVGYCADLNESLREHFKCLKPGGYEVLVVGNSLHGNKDSAFLFASDLLIAALASVNGFQVEGLNIARSMKRRLSGNHFLRESVIVLRKPNA